MTCVRCYALAIGYGTLVGVLAAAYANRLPIVAGNNLSPEFDRCSFAHIDKPFTV